MSKIKFMSFLICMSLMVGCATNWPKQLERKLSLLDKKGLVLATVTFDNKLNKGSLLPFSFLIGKNGDDNYEKYRFPTQALRALTENRKFYLIVMDVNSGNYFFYSVRGRIIGGFLHPLFEVPMLMGFQAKENEISYIGNIHLVLREKASDSELRAGPFTPFIDQGSIVPSGTFDVEINDTYERDMNEFEKVFPNLKGHSVVKRILPSWRRPSSQEFEPKKSHYFFY